MYEVSIKTFGKISSEEFYIVPELKFGFDYNQNAVSNLKYLGVSPFPKPNTKYSNDLISILIKNYMYSFERFIEKEIYEYKVKNYLNKKNSYNMSDFDYILDKIIDEYTKMIKTTISHIVISGGDWVLTPIQVQDNGYHPVLNSHLNFLVHELIRKPIDVWLEPIYCNSSIDIELALIDKSKSEPLKTKIKSISIEDRSTSYTIDKKQDYPKIQ